MGPLLFLIFLNDIESNIDSDISLFADDTSLLHIFSKSYVAEKIINSDLLKLQSWANSWLVKFNPVKTKYMIISNKNPKSSLNILLGGNKIEKVKTLKHLGIIFSEDFKWKNHIENIVKSAKMKIGALFRTRGTLRRKDKIKLYTAMIRPALEYGGVIYDNCTISDSMKLESVQSFAARVCVGALRQTNYENLCNELNWQKLETRRKISKAILTYKILNSLTPPYLKPNFLFKDSKTSNLRNKSMFVYPKCRLTSFASSFFPSQSKMFNNLQPETVNSETLSIFRKRISKKYSGQLSGDDHVAFATLSSYYGKF